MNDERKKPKMRSVNVASNHMLRPFRIVQERGASRGFSLLETMLASFLATLLGMLLAMSCATFGRPALEVDARARITQEGILAAQSIACDLGGYLADSAGRIGTTATAAQYSFDDWDLSSGSALVLKYYGPNSSDPTTESQVTYKLSGNQLVRDDTATGNTTIIASYVTAFSVSQDPDIAALALIEITVMFRYFSATFTLIGVKPTALIGVSPT
jgi:hypothetical protein